ncbi:ABC transporter, ATP-binding protein [Leptospira interrogans serovar Canicola]|nr:ABC transporter, ATP-binding protein [Leptospira interrogans serovar Canicola]
MYFWFSEMVLFLGTCKFGVSICVDWKLGLTGSKIVD